MEGIINAITSNTLYLAIAVILGIIMAISIIKKLIKMIFISILVIIIYLGYLAYTGQKIPKTKEETIEHISNKLQKGKALIGEKGKKLIEENLKNLKKAE